MGFTRLSRVTILVLVVLFFFLGPNRGMASEGIDPLQLEGEEETWQLTLDISRYLDGFSVHRRNKSGLWEEKKTIEGTRYAISTNFDVNEGIGFRGGFSYYSDSVRLKKTNLWTGARETSEESSSSFGDAELKLKMDIWGNSEIESYFLLPLLGGQAGFGLVWSRDPLMLLPKLRTDGTEFGLNTGISFIANSRMALTGNISMEKRENSSAIGLGVGVAYRNGEYDGIRVAAALREGNSTRISLELGLSYGGEK